MNIHPIIVHFPIALLVCYAIIEIFPLNKWYPRFPWDSVKLFLVLLGTVGAVAALGTGSLAEHSSQWTLRNVLRVHKSFASISTFIFGILTAAYFIRWIFQQYSGLFVGPLSALSLLKKIADFILKRWIVVPLALIGLVTILVTGILGGIIVYGPNLDPFTKFMYSVFFG